MGDIIGVEGNIDAPGFINVAKAPKLSLVPDSSFPVGYGGKGGMNFTLKSKTMLKSVKLTAGEPKSPGLATAKFNTGTVLPSSLPHCEIFADTLTVTAYTPPRHGANPDPDGNMITRISEALIGADLISNGVKNVLEFLRDVSGDIYGEVLGIKCEHSVTGKLTVFAHKICDGDGYPELSINVRYPYSASFDEIKEKISAACEARGFELIKAQNGTPAYLLDGNSEIVQLLCKASREVLGEDLKPYTLRGGTYANRLPNAYPFGMSGNLPPEDFEKGRGGAHGVDEAVSISRLKRAMKIYARALIYLNNFKW
jgi:succinyl-diaminopimelate desuccinylase